MIGIQNRYKLVFLVLFILTIIFIGVLLFLVYNYQTPKIPSKGVFVWREI